VDFQVKACPELVEGWRPWLLTPNIGWCYWPKRRVAVNDPSVAWAVSGTEYAGAAAVSRTSEGLFLGWLSRQLPQMPNNEAEYHAALPGLRLAHILNADVLEIVSDSEVLVRQMQGQSRVLRSKNF
jgi:hypothetical protein